MNNIYREELSGYKIAFNENNERTKVPRYFEIRPFDSDSVSIFYTARSNFKRKDGIDVGDLVYFKANTMLGYKYSKISESSGSCEDIAEVLGHFLIKNLNNDIGNDAVLKTTPYNFTCLENPAFSSFIDRGTNHMVSSSSMHGCISKNAVDQMAHIVHGHELLRLILPKSDIFRSSENTIVNYNKALDAYKQQHEEVGYKVYIDPICNRYLANTMFFDYFIANSDRHCKNVNFQKYEFKNKTIAIRPLPIIDNGAGFAMQSPDTEELYKKQYEYLVNDGKIEHQQDGVRNPFEIQYDLSAGSEIFSNPELTTLTSNLSYEQQMLMLISQNKILFNDFRNIYSNINLSKAYKSIYEDSCFNLNNFIKNITTVLDAALFYKKERISLAIAEILGVEFDEKAFKENPLKYVDMLGEIVKDNELTVKIANKDEISKFNDKIDELKAERQKI